MNFLIAPYRFIPAIKIDQKLQTDIHGSLMFCMYFYGSFVGLNYFFFIEIIVMLSFLQVRIRHIKVRYSHSLAFEFSRTFTSLIPAMIRQYLLAFLFLKSVIKSTKRDPNRQKFH